MTTTRRHDEAKRQRDLLAAILAPRADASTLVLRETPERAARGLAAYRANAEALAERALSAAYGNIRAMLGDENFAHLAAEFWRAQPPLRGDVAVWGATFAVWLEAHPGMAAWPYLPDCARLDWALHLNERAGDATFDADTLGLLSDADPARLRFELMPGTVVLSSPWPIVTIHRAHSSHADTDFAAAREAINSELAQHALVCRDGWRAEVTELDATQARWMRALSAGDSIAHALDSAGPDFDFAAWLAQAIQNRWLKGVVRIGD